MLKPATKEAYDLLHQGSLALSQVEANGIRIDVGYLDDTIETVGRGVETLEEDLRGTKTYKEWRKIYGSGTNLDSPAQIRHVLFEVLGHPVTHKTSTGLAKVDEESLEKIKDPFVKKFLKVKKLDNLRRTHLAGIRREVVNGRIHPTFPLNTVRTYRGSCFEPNFQTIPIRNSEFAELIRQCFIPRKGGRLVELDFKSIEVKVSACYNKDPALIRYVSDPKTDMHRDSSVDVFLLDQDDVSKDVRDHVKNKFVFPEFYGSYWGNCAEALYDAIETFDLKTVSGIKLKKHLKRKGITELGEIDGESKPQKGTFARHLQKAEEALWKRFKVYHEWKQQNYQQYLKNGGINTKTGFRLEGHFGFNDVSNYGIQGSAFHCNLWALIQLQNWITKNNMETMIIGQIHDSILADCPDDEVEDYIAQATQITMRELPKHWDWIIVPLSVDMAVTPIDGSWHEKKKYA